MRRGALLVAAVVLLVVLSTTAMANIADWSLNGPPELPLAEYEGVERPVCTRRTLDQSPLEVGDVTFMVDVLALDVTGQQHIDARVFRIHGDGWRLWPSHAEVESELGDRFADFQAGRHGVAAYEDHWDHMIVSLEYQHARLLRNATDLHYSLTFDTYRERLVGFTLEDPLTVQLEFTLHLDECQ